MPIRTISNTTQHLSIRLNAIMRSNIISRKNMPNTEAAIKFTVSILNHAFGLKKWSEAMHKSMGTYVAKVLNSIESITREGIRLIMSQSPVMTIATANKISAMMMQRIYCISRLQESVDKMNSLIHQVMTTPNDNSDLKRKVLELLGQMRTPTLPIVDLAALNPTKKARSLWQIIKK